MKKLLVRSLAGLILVLVTAYGVQADERAVDGREAEGLREKMQNLHREIIELKEAGKHEEAQKLATYAETLLRKARGEGAEKKTRQVEEKQAVKKHAQSAEERLKALHQKLEALRDAGRGEEAEQLQRQIREEMSRRTPAHPKEEAGDARQIPHLLEAAEHLRAAGMIDLAEQLSRQAAERKERLAHGEPRHEHPPVVAELAEQVQQLRREVQELREIVKRMADRGAH